MNIRAAFIIYLILSSIFVALIVICAVNSLYFGVLLWMCILAFTAIAFIMAWKSQLLS